MFLGCLLEIVLRLTINIVVHFSYYIHYEELYKRDLCICVLDLFKTYYISAHTNVNLDNRNQRGINVNLQFKPILMIT